MSRPLKKTDKGNRSITDFFTPRSSMGTQSSSQQASSQPSMSQATSTKKSGLKPATKQTTKKNISSTHDKSIISISSGSGDDPLFVSATTRRTRVSMPDDTMDAAVVLSGPTKSKTASNVKTAVFAKPTNTRKTLSSAKTVVKRRPRAAAGSEVGSSTSKPPTRRKRKLDLTDSSDDEIFKPDPNAMNAALTRAPVPRIVSAPPKSTPSKARVDVPSSPSTRSASSKRRRLSTQDSRGLCQDSGDDSDVVPSSVSDEHELVLPKSPQANVKTVKKNIGRWRLDTSPDFPERDRSPPPSDYPSTSPVSSSPSHEITALPLGQAPDYETDLDVDMADAADALSKHNTLRCSYSEAEVKQQLLPLESNSSLASIASRFPTSADFASGSLSAGESAFRSCTPPATEVEAPLPPLPPTPVALDAETKTRQWIEKVKADALEAAMKAQQENADDEIELRSVSDSDEELPSTLSALLARPGKRCNQRGAESSPLSSLPSSPAPCDLQPKAGPSTRYSLRRRDPVQNPKRRSSSPDGDEDLSACQPPKKRVANPLNKLLREKETREKSGKGIEDIRRAEAVLHDESRARKKESLLEEMAREEHSDDDAIWADEEAAMNVVHQRSRQENAFSVNRAFDDYDSDSDEPVELDITEATKHLGDEQGEAIGKILTTDRKGWLSKGRSKKRLAKGILLWGAIDQDSVSVMEEDTEEALHLPFSEDQIAGDQVLSFLNSVIATGDLAWLSGLLASQLLLQCGDAYMPGLVDWLSKLCLFEDEELSDQAYLCLVALASRLPVRCNLSTPFVRCLWELGAKSSLMETCGLAPCKDVRRRQASPDVISTFVTRILDVVKAFARHNVVEHEDIPNMIMVLLLIGFDTNSSAELRSEAMVIIDILGSMVPASSSGHSDMEPVLCKRLLHFSDELTPVNKAFLVSFFCGGCPLMARVARWLSHGLLVGDHIFDEQPYSSLPALEPIADLLSPPGGSKAMFDVVSGAEEDNYFDDLLCYVQILNRAFNDVPAYVQEEKRLAAVNSQLSTNGVAPASPEKTKTELQRIKHSLDVLHGKIVDTRAAHLDRSRVKAALQQLSFRIYYAREAALKWYRAPRPANLRAYFRKPT